MQPAYWTIFKRPSKTSLVGWLSNCWEAHITARLRAWYQTKKDAVGKNTIRATLGVALDQQTVWSVHTGPSSWNSDYLGFSRPGIQNSICDYSLGRSQGPIVSHLFGSITQPGHGSPTIDRRCTYMHIHTYARRYSWENGATEKGLNRIPKLNSVMRCMYACKGNQKWNRSRSCACSAVRCTDNQILCLHYCTRRRRSRNRSPIMVQ